MSLPTQRRRKNHPWDHYKSVRQEMPSLTQSASSSSSPSSGSSNKQKSNYRTPQHQKDSSDTKIFRGAEILRRQIVEGTFRDDKEIMYLHHRTSATHEPFEEVDDPQDGSYASDWSDPRPPPPERETSKSNGYPWSPEPLRNPSQFVFPTTGDAKYWANYVSSDEDDERQNNMDENTADLLTRATNILTEPSEARVFPFQAADVQYSSKHASNQLLVQKVNDLEPTAFDSSFGQLFPEMNCGSGSAYFPSNLAGPWQTEQAPHSDQPSRELKMNFPCHQHSWELLKDLQENEEGLLRQSQSQTRQSKVERLSCNPVLSVAVQASQQQRNEEPLQHEPAQPQQSRPNRRDPNLALVAPPRLVKGPDPAFSILPPRSAEYQKLLTNPGFRHAQRAGILWQSLVSQHVRFPAQWWNGTRNPPMGVGGRKPWSHVGRHRVRDNTFLQHMVPSRGSAGRLLLHVIIRDVMTGEPILDLAVGSFHPNARGVRNSFRYDPSLQSCRDIWLAFRSRSEEISVIESLLLHGRAPEQSPLGAKHAVDNENMRAVFGELPPVHTIMALENDLYHLFSRQMDGTVPPAAILLEKYVADW